MHKVNGRKLSFKFHLLSPISSVRERALAAARSSSVHFYTRAMRRSAAQTHSTKLSLVAELLQRSIVRHWILLFSGSIWLSERENIAGGRQIYKKHCKTSQQENGWSYNARANNSREMYTSAIKESETSTPIKRASLKA